jgi:predicted lipoprotein
MYASLAAAAFIAIGAAPAKAETDYAGIAREALGEVIRPGYSALAETTGGLSGKVQALCQQPSSGALKDAKDAFASSVGASS